MTIIYTYICERCHYRTDIKETIKEHMLKMHGVTGLFGKGYKTIKKYKNKKVINL